MLGSSFWFGAVCVFVKCVCLFLVRLFGLLITCLVGDWVVGVWLEFCFLADFLVLDELFIGGSVLCWGQVVGLGRYLFL